MVDLVPLISEKGKQFLQDVEMNEWPYQKILHNIFAKQVGPKNCGIVTCALVMSASHLGQKHPNDTGDKGPYTEENMFTFNQTTSVATEDYVNTYGLTLDELAQILLSHGYKVDKCYGSDFSIEEFRDNAKSALANKNCNQGIIVNYDMSVLGQVPFGGHHSPLGAYHVDEDRFLILDTWPVTPLTWVKTQDLYNAMNTEDGSSKKPRGFCVVHK